MVFEVLSTEALKAIDHVDGDFLVAELVPGRTDYLDTHGFARHLEIFDGNSTLVSFRKFGHDDVAACQAV